MTGGSESLLEISFYSPTLNTKIVVPAQAGTHTPQRFGSITEASLFHDN